MTEPVATSTVATDVLPLLHVPPAVRSVRLVVIPIHTNAVPGIADGSAPTVNEVVTLQPAPSEYVMFVVPGDIPETRPVPDPTRATTVLLLVQVPPADALLKSVVLPKQIFVLPEIAEGNALTTTVVVAAQPVPIEYSITDVPVAKPLTKPVAEPTVATAVLLLLHTPPAVPSLKAVVRPTQNCVVPVISAGDPTTDKVADAVQPAPSE